MRGGGAQTPGAGAGDSDLWVRADTLRPEVGKGPGEQFQAEIVACVMTGVTSSLWGGGCAGEKGAFSGQDSFIRPDLWGRAGAGGGGDDRSAERRGERGAGWGAAPGARRLGSTSPLQTASQLLANQLLDSIHCRVGTKKWLFIRILVWYCSAPHKRHFIMWRDPPFSREKQ